MAFQGYEASEDDSIKVAIRVRPMNDIEDGTENVVSVEQDDNAIVLHSHNEQKLFTFDYVADSDTTQEEIFVTVGKSICESCLKGYNGTVFAYGQTGAGKTYTMQGPMYDGAESAKEHRGLIQRMFEYVFTYISREEKKSGGNKQFLCKASYIEIYNEIIYDLLDPCATRGLNIREDIKKGVFVDNLIEVSANSPEDCYEVLVTGADNRHVGATSMNRESSRSHSVFTLVIQSKEMVDGLTNIRESRLNLVDLAGSERQKLTDAAGARLKEAGGINKSLSALGNVIMALVDVTNGKSRHVAYRDSKLTFLLKDSLGGNTKTYMIANVSPSAKCFGETLSTLKFARRAKLIINTATINEDSQGNVGALREEIKRLKGELVAAQAAQSAGVGGTGAGTGGASTAETSARIYDLEKLLAEALEQHKHALEDAAKLAGRIGNLSTVVEAKDKAVLARSLIIKLRDARIERLLSGTDEAKDERIAELTGEIAQLQELLEHDPTKVELAVENADLRERLSTLLSEFGGDVDERNTQLVKLHYWAQGLAAELEVATNTRRTLEKKIKRLEAKTRRSISDAAAAVPTKNIELEKWQAQMEFEARLNKVQNELNATRDAANTADETANARIVELEADLAAATKGMEELKSARSSEKLAHSLEVDSYKATISALRAAAASGATEDLEAELETVTKDKEKIAAALEEANDQIRVLNQEMAKAEARASQTAEMAAKSKAADAAELSALRSQLMELQNTVDAASEREGELVKKVAEMEATVEETKNQMEDEAARVAGVVAEATAAKESAEQDLMAAEAAAAASEKELFSLRTAHEELVEQHETLEEEFEFNAEQLVTLQKLQAKAVTRAKEAEAKSREAAAEIEGHLEAIDKLRQEVQEAAKGSGEATANVLGENARLIDEVNALKAEIDGMNMAAEEAANTQRETSEQLAAANARIEKLESGRSGLTEALNEARQAKAEVESALESVRGDLADANGLVAKHEETIDELNSSVATLQGEIEALAAARDAASAEHSEQIEELMVELRARQAALEAETAAKATLESESAGRISELESAVSEAMSAAETAVAEATEAAAQEVASMEKAASESAEASAARISELEHALAAASAEAEKYCDLFNSASQEANAETSKAIEASKKLETRVADALAAAAAAKSETEAARAEVAELQAERAAYKEKVDLFVKLQGEWDAARDAKNAELETLNAALAEAKAAAASASAAAAELEQARESAEAQAIESVATKVAEIATLRSAVGEAEAKASELSAEIAAKGQELARLTEENMTLKTTLESTLEKSEALTAEVAAVKAAEDDAFEQSRIYQQKLERLQEETKNREAETATAIANLRKEIAELSGHHNTKQKIRHVQLVKEENMTLKKEAAEIEREVIRQKRTNERLAAEVSRLRQMLDKENVPFDGDGEGDALRLEDYTRQNKALTDELNALTSGLLQTFKATNNGDGASAVDVSLEQVKMVEDLVRVVKSVETSLSANSSFMSAKSMNESVSELVGNASGVLNDSAAN